MQDFVEKNARAIQEHFEEQFESYQDQVASMAAHQQAIETKIDSYKEQFEEMKEVLCSMNALIKSKSNRSESSRGSTDMETVVPAHTAAPVGRR